MKKISLIILLILSVTSLFAQIKRYEIESAIIEYDINGSGNMTGMATKISGKSTVFFKNYGIIELSDEKINQNLMGQNEYTHDIIKIEDDTVYSVDFEEKVIYKQKITASEKEMMVKDTNEKSLKDLGGKKIGTEKVAGYKCDIWQLKGSKICIYKGIPLKMQTNTMGITQVQIAKKVQLNVSIDDDKFKLPNFPIKSQADMMKDVNSQMEGMTLEQKKMMQDMMKNMGNIMGGQK